MYSNIFENIKTKEDVDALEADIVAMESSVFNKKKKINVSSFGEKFLVGLGKEQIEELKEKLKSLREVKMTIAVDPTKELVDSIFSEVALNVGEGFYLNLKKDAEILGGAIITFGGRYFDASLIKKIEGHFPSQKT